MSAMAEGLPNSTFQWMTCSFSFFASNESRPWGFIHVNFVIVAFLRTMLVVSYAASEWCAKLTAGLIKNNVTIKTSATRWVFMICLLRSMSETAEILNEY